MHHGNQNGMFPFYMICDSWDSTVAHSDVAQFAVHLAFTVRGSTWAVSAKVEPSREVNNWKLSKDPRDILCS